jgi:hypothetical protein
MITIAIEKKNDVLDLTWLGNDNTTDEDQFICSDCNVKLIVKADDTAHLGFAYNRLICPQCLLIVDPEKQDDISQNVKHKESLHTLTDNDNNTKPYVSVVPYTAKDDLEVHDVLEEYYDKDEAQDFANHGQIVSTVQTITKSSVDGRILRQDYDAFEG